MREYYTEVYYARLLKSNVNYQTNKNQSYGNSQRIHPLHGDPADTNKSVTTKTPSKTEAINRKLEQLFGSDHGPKPISIETYRKRGKTHDRIETKTIKKRGGKLNAARCKIGNLKRLIKLVIALEEKIVFIRQLRAAKLEEKQRLKDKRQKKDDVMDNMFTNLFRLGEQCTTQEP